VDTVVTTTLRARLAQPDLAELLPTTDSWEAEPTPRRSLSCAPGARIEADYDEDLIDGRQYRVATEKVRAEMETAQARLAASAPGHAPRGSCRVPEIRQPRSTPLL
jgi:site-specific DNA recombinase